MPLVERRGDQVLTESRLNAIASTDFLIIFLLADPCARCTALFWSFENWKVGSIWIEALHYKTANSGYVTHSSGHWSFLHAMARILPPHCWEICCCMHQSTCFLFDCTIFVYVPTHIYVFFLSMRLAIFPTAYPTPGTWALLLVRWTFNKAWARSCHAMMYLDLVHRKKFPKYFQRRWRYRGIRMERVEGFKWWGMVTGVDDCGNDWPC